MFKIPDDYDLIRRKCLKLLKDIHKRCENKDNKHPTYINIKCTIDDKQEDLYVFWYYHELKKLQPNHPEDTIFAIDRINNMGYYSLNNLQLLSIRDNERKKALDHSIQYCGREPYKGEKYCHGCHTIHNKDNFNMDKAEIDGLRGNCKQCTKQTNKKSRLKNG